MSKKAALIHLIFFVLLVVYGTYHLFKGQFEYTVATIPIFAIYYVFVIARSQRADFESDKDDKP